MILATTFAGVMTSCVPGAVELPAHQEAVLAASSRLMRFADRADLAQRATRDLATLVRFNPSDCECPAWEAYLFGRWERVTLVAGRYAPEDVGAALASSSWPRELVMVARLERRDEISRDEWGWGYATLDVLELRNRPVMVGEEER